MEKMFHSVRFWTYGEGGENTSSMKPRCEDPNRASAQNFARQRPTGKALGVKIIRCPSLSMKPPPLPSLTIVWFYRGVRLKVGEPEHGTGDRNVPGTRRQECRYHVAQAFQPAGKGDFPVARPSPAFNHTLYRERSDREYLKLHFDEKTRARRTAVRAPEVDAAGAGSPDGIAGLLVRPTGDQT